MRQENAKKRKKKQEVSTHWNVLSKINPMITQDDIEAMHLKAFPGDQKFIDMSPGRIDHILIDHYDSDYERNWLETDVFAKDENSGLRPFIMRLMLFRRMGKHSFILGPTMQELMSQSTFKGIEADFIRLPYPMIYIHFLDSEFKYYDEYLDTEMTINGLYVSEGRLEGTNSVLLDFMFWASGKDFTDSAVRYFTLVFEEQGGKISSASFRGEFENEPEDQVNAFALAANASINMLLYMNSANPEIREEETGSPGRYRMLESKFNKEKSPGKQAKLRAEKEAATPHRVTWIAEKSEKKFSRLASQMRRGKVKAHFRKGHFKSQWVGPRNDPSMPSPFGSHKIIIWIKPTIVGEGEVQERKAYAFDVDRKSRKKNPQRPLLSSGREENPVMRSLATYRPNYIRAVPASMPDKSVPFYMDRRVASLGSFIKVFDNSQIYKPMPQYVVLDPSFPVEPMVMGSSAFMVERIKGKEEQMRRGETWHNPLQRSPDGRIQAPYNWYSEEILFENIYVAWIKWRSWTTHLKEVDDAFILMGQTVEGDAFHSADEPGPTDREGIRDWIQGHITEEINLTQGFLLDSILDRILSEAVFTNSYRRDEAERQLARNYSQMLREQADSIEVIATIRPKAIFTKNDFRMWTRDVKRFIKFRKEGLERHRKNVLSEGVMDDLQSAWELALF
jgi:hypothetical protein